MMVAAMVLVMVVVMVAIMVVAAVVVVVVEVMGCTGSDGGGVSGAVGFWQGYVDSTVILLVSGRNGHDDCLC